MEQSMRRIPIAGPWITRKEIDYVKDAVERAWYENANIYHEAFEKAFARYVNRRFAVSLPSCTSAIHLSLLALGIGPGDEVIVPDITWIATAAPIIYVGATPIFADIDPNTWCISPKSFEQYITHKTKAVITVDLYGGMPEYDEILQIARRYNIAVIEDAAQAIGSEYKGKKAGSFGNISVFSFHGTKTLTTGEGGMLLTDDEKIYNRVLFLRDHGRDPEKMFWNTEVAYKYKMSCMQAALGLAQLERIDELVAKKRQIFSWYKEQLSALISDLNCALNYELPYVKNSFWMVTIIVNPSIGITKEKLISLLSERNIDTRPFFYPLSALPAFSHLEQAKIASKQNKVSYTLSQYGLNLPSALRLTQEEVKYVCDALKDILYSLGRRKNGYGT